MAVNGSSIMADPTNGARIAARKAARTTVAPTHEALVNAIRTAAVLHAERLGRITFEDAKRLRAVRVMYGVGSHAGARGVCYYGRWTNAAGETVDLIEIAASVQESWIQLAGTTVHELGHVLAGHAAGHGTAWADASVALGLGGLTGTHRVTGAPIKSKRPAAAGQRYSLSMFDPTLRAAIVALVASMVDGTPAFGATIGGLAGIFGGMVARPCSAGQGTRGGTSRGKGSGSRLRLYECSCPRPVKVRVASDTFDATCNVCETVFANPNGTGPGTTVAGLAPD